MVLYGWSKEELKIMGKLGYSMGFFKVKHEWFDDKKQDQE